DEDLTADSTVEKEIEDLYESTLSQITIKKEELANKKLTLKSVILKFKVIDKSQFSALSMYAIEKSEAGAFEAKVLTSKATGNGNGLKGLSLPLLQEVTFDANGKFTGNINSANQLNVAIDNKGITLASDVQ